MTTKVADRFLIPLDQCNICGKCRYSKEGWHSFPTYLTLYCEDCSKYVPEHIWPYESIKTKVI
jgi:hypothetical protein